MEEITKAFDRISDDYDNWYEKANAIFESEIRAIKHLLPLDPAGRMTLEIGTGTGRFASALGIEFGADPSFNMLRLAKKRGVESVLAAGEDLPFKDQAFTTIFIIFALCFFREPLKVLKESFRVLGAGDTLILAFVNRDSCWGESYEAKKKEGHPIYRHARFYTYEEVEVLLSQAGLQIVKVCSTLFQSPDEVAEIEDPRKGFVNKAGLIVIAARRS